MLDANKQGLAQCHAAHHQNSGRRAKKTDKGSDDEIVRGDRHRVGRNESDLARPQRVRHQVAEQRRDGDRRQAVRRIAADDQLEAVKGAGERRAERAGNSAGGATADQDAQVGAPQPKCHADTRGDAAGQLGIAGFDADRRAYPARPNGLHGDDNAAEKRHAAAVQRVRLDRIDLALRPPAHDQFAGDAEDDAAGERHRNRHHRIEPQQSRQPHAGLEAKQDLVQQSTLAPIAATTRPAIAPTSAASAIRLDSRARTNARRRRGISNPLVNLIDQDGVTIVIAAPESRYKGTGAIRACSHSRLARSLTRSARCRIRPRWLLPQRPHSLMLCAGQPVPAQTSSATLQGKAAFGDWHTDSPGKRRLITPSDLPAPDPAQSARNFVRTVARTETQKPSVPKGFEVNLFASGLASPRLHPRRAERRRVRG